MIGLRRGKWWGIRSLCVSVLLIMQFAFALGLFHSNQFGIYPQPINLNPNPYDEVVNFLNIQARQYHLKNIVIMDNVETALPVDPHTLTMMAELNGLSYKMGMPSYSVYSGEIIQTFHREHEAVFLIDKKSQMLVSATAAAVYAEKFAREVNPTLRVWYEFLRYYSADKLRDLGWKIGPCMVVKALDQNDYQGCLLI